MTDTTKLKAVCRIRSDDLERQVFHFKENGDGSVNLRIKSGVQVGYPPDNKKIADERISIHASKDDPEFNLIKSHLYYEDGSSEPPAYCKTDAIKSKGKFAHITTIRLSDLKHAIYDVPTLKNGFLAISFGGFDTRIHTPYVDLFVGDRSSEFKCESNEFAKFELLSTKFKFVILVRLQYMPASPTSNSMGTLTSGYAMYLDDEPGFLHHFYNGMSVDECLSKVAFLQTVMKVQHIDEVIAIIGKGLKPETIERMAEAREFFMSELGSKHLDEQMKSMVLYNSKGDFKSELQGL